MIQAAYIVPITEYERGYGQRLDNHMLCESLKEAETFQREFNAKNTEKTAPDWYMIASAPRLIEIPMSVAIRLQNEGRHYIGRVLNFK